MSIKEFFGIELPIIQAPMAGVQDSALAIAVSNAGGLGSLPAAMLSIDELRKNLLTIRQQTPKPFNVNFFCHQPPIFSEDDERIWISALEPYYRELDLDVNAIPPSAGRAPFTSEAAELLEEFKPPIVSFHFGLPTPELLQRVRASGARIVASATTVAEAKWLEARGVDAIIAQGSEAGGHRGIFLTNDISTQVGTFALLPQIVKAVNVPVIAAGGIADAKGVAAAMALGATAAQIGTAYLLCPEASTSAVHRVALRSEAARVTALTNIFSGKPARGIMNRIMRELGPMSRAVPAFPLATRAIAPLRAAAEKEGRDDFSPLWAGQNTSGCKAIAAAELTYELAGIDR